MHLYKYCYMFILSRNAAIIPILAYINNGTISTLNYPLFTSCLYICSCLPCICLLSRECSVYLLLFLLQVLGFRKRFRWLAMYATFFISAVFHEYIIIVTFRFFYPVLFILFAFFGGE